MGLRLGLALLLVLTCSPVVYAGDVWTSAVVIAEGQRTLSSTLNVTTQPINGVTAETAQNGTISSQIVNIPPHDFVSINGGGFPATLAWCHFSGAGINVLTVRVAMCVLNPAPDDKCYVVVEGY